MSTPVFPYQVRQDPKTQTYHFEDAQGECFACVDVPTYELLRWYFWTLFGLGERDEPDQFRVGG